ncbi:MAG: CRISPR-associated protein, partial [Sulfolobaceae archaeon]
MNNNRFTQEKLIELVERSLSSITFRQGIKEAKYKSPQSYAFHTISAGVLAFDVCKAIYFASDMGRIQLEKLSNNYNMPEEELCFFGGFLHDWNKLEGKEDAAKEIIKKLNLNDPETFLYGISTMAEGHLPDNRHLPLWVSIKLADMFLISDISSVKDVLYHASSDAYRNAISMLKEYGLEIGYISSTFRLFTLVASKDILDRIIDPKMGYFPLMSYPDGLVFLRKRDAPPILLTKVIDVLRSYIFSSLPEDIEGKVDEIKRCMQSKAELFKQMNIDVKSALYDEKGKLRQVNVFLPTKICKPFEDIVGNLDNKSKFEVAKKVIQEARNEIPYWVLIYFIHRFSKSDENYIREGLNIKERSLAYLIDITPEEVQKMIDEILKLLEKRYLNLQTTDYTLQYYVKHSFSGDVIDDLPNLTNKPNNYCVVCGMAIYSENAVRFVQYASELKGKAEIWIPREKGLDEIDEVRDDWKVCPICIYEANLVKGKITPPYFIITFYPGVAISLLGIIDFDFSNKGIKYYINEGETYLNVLKELGGKVSPNPVKPLPGYFTSKVIVRAVDTTDMISSATRLTKKELNHLLPYAPMLSIIYLTSPIMISSNIYDIPSIQRNVIAISSTFNYSFIKSLDSNILTIYSALAYSAKYDVMRRMYKRKEELDDYLSYLTGEEDLFSAVDPSLGVLSIGMGVGTPIELDEKFFSSFLRISNYLLKIAGMVSNMGESIRSSIFSIAYVLKEVIKTQDVSKYDIIGFLRDGVEMFFKTSSVLINKEDRIGVSINAAISSLENKYTLNDEQRKKVYSALEGIFEALYKIENDSNRSLALSI